MYIFKSWKTLIKVAPRNLVVVFGGFFKYRLVVVEPERFVLTPRLFKSNNFQFISEFSFYENQSLKIIRSQYNSSTSENRADWEKSR